MDTASQVTTEAGSTIKSLTLNVSALTDESLTDVTASAQHTGAGLQAGSGPSESDTLQADRIIDLNSNILLPGAADPVLIIDANGNVVDQELITFTQTDTLILVDNLVNQGGFGGTVNLVVNKSNRDSLMTNPRVIKGAPAVTFQSGYDEVVIQNESPKVLVLQRMDVANESATAANSINVSGDPTTTEFTPTTNSTPGETSIKVENSGLIGLAGFIDNPFGETSISGTGIVADSMFSGIPASEASNLGNGTISQAVIDAFATAGYALSNPTVSTVEVGKRWTIKDDDSEYTVAANGNLVVFPSVNSVNPRAIRTNTLNLVAGNGVIGNDNYGIQVLAGDQGSTLLNGSANQSIRIELFGGDLEVDSVSSGDKLQLLAAGSILDANADDAVNITASSLVLAATPDASVGATANERAIGSLTDALEVRVAGEMSATAGGHVVLTEVGASMNPLRISSSLGDIVLTATDAESFGQNIVLSDSASVIAPSGSISFYVGDNFQHSGLIRAGAAINVVADSEGLDVGTGSLLEFNGQLQASTSINITTSTDEDTIYFKRLDAAVPVNIVTGAGRDEINIGSEAGLLDVVTSTFTIDAGEEPTAFADSLIVDRITLDDSGRTANSPVAISSIASAVGDAALIYENKNIHYIGAEEL
ncbi:MAG: hypothetical protein KDA92_24200, partial [Planctomycetales bacterium]|nr:hypothetical protein [Planctomycetales bacterium]